MVGQGKTDFLGSPIQLRSEENITVLLKRGGGRSTLIKKKCQADGFIKKIRKKQGSEKLKIYGAPLTNVRIFQLGQRSGVGGGERRRLMFNSL